MCKGVRDGAFVLVMIDLDNTLGNRTVAVQAWVAEFAEQRGLPSGAHEWILERDNDGYSARTDVFAGIRAKWNLPEPIDQLVADYQEQIVEMAAPTEGAIDCLVEMRSRGWKIAIVTNGSTKQQHGKIDTIGFRSMVDAVIVSGDLDIKKPDARIYQAAAQATGESLEGAWMVGDSALHDVVGAHMLDCKTVWLHRDREWPKEHSCRPTVVLGDLTGLVAVIDAHS